jgi:hypothetical protein
LSDQINSTSDHPSSFPNHFSPYGSGVLSLDQVRVVPERILASDAQIRLRQSRYLDFLAREVARFFAVALPPFFPPLRLEAVLDFLPRPEPLFLPP